MESTELQQLGFLAEALQFDRLFYVIFGMAGLVGTVKIVQHFSQRLQASWPARRVLVLQVATMINFALYIGGGSILIYAVLQPPKEVLLAIAGSAAVAIGISLKDIVASIVAGIILLFDRPFQVGDRVAFGGSYGEIVGIGLRTVKMATLDDNLVTIPNSRFLTDIVSSGNAGSLDMMIVVDFHIATTANIKLAEKIVREVVVTSRYVFLKKPVSIVFSEVEIAERIALRLKAKAYVLDCRFEKAFETDIVMRTIELFNEKCIERPVRS